MTEEPDSPAPQGSEEAVRVELSAPATPPLEEEAPRAQDHRPNLDQRQAAIHTERRAAGPDRPVDQEPDALEDEAPQHDDVPATDPAEDSQE
jgi:hypothetical protein